MLCTGRSCNGDFHTSISTHYCYCSQSHAFNNFVHHNMCSLHSQVTLIRDRGTAAVEQSNDGKSQSIRNMLQKPLLDSLPLIAQHVTF